MLRPIVSLMVVMALAALGCGGGGEAPEPTPRCGDGVVQKGEACDDGNGVDGDACTNSCAVALCGDGVVQKGVEACDDGNFDDNDACRTTCELAKCGDGVVRAGVEACDDGNADDGDGCTASCKLPSCGDGVVQKGEPCHDGNLDDTDGCSNTCLKSSCGDGIVQSDETCDDGNQNAFDACLPSCEAAKCGDGVVWVGVEACDDGNTLDGDGCTGTCGLPSCGDGVVQPGEVCDDGNKSDTDACLSSCLAAKCGDGKLHVGFEECDDGNTVDGDGCNADCTLSGCGDGILVPPEECDDGNGDDDDACLNTCETAKCGDGVVWAGIEACDDGNGVSGDTCTNACTKAACGDGVVWIGVEACDDGNDASDDACLATCAKASCGDGFVYAGVEDCDDQNLDNTDGCLIDCRAWDPCAGFAITGISAASACLNAVPQKITLSGTGFLTVNGAPPTVTFGGQPATGVTLGGCQPISLVYNAVTTCTSLTLDVPPGLALGTYDITVANATTKSCPQTTQFSVAAPPLVTSVAPTPVCEGPNSFTVGGTGFVPGSQVSFSNVSPTKTTFVSAAQILASFASISPGTYDVTVSNGPGCATTKLNAVTVLKDPSVFFVDPQVVYSGIDLQVTIYVSGINGSNVTSVGVRPSGSNQPYQNLAFTYDPAKPNRIQAVVPKGQAAGSYDVQIIDANGCPGEVATAFSVTNQVSVALTSIKPPFGWTGSPTGVTLAAQNPPPVGKAAFQNGASVYLNPVGGGLATNLGSVAYFDPSQLSALVPAGLPAGKYDVVVVNPSGAVGLLPAGFTVTTDPPPVIDFISPGSIPNSGPATVVISGSGFKAGASVQLTCLDPANATTNVPVTVNSVAATSISTTVPASIAAGSACVVRVTNTDQAYGEFSALGVTNPAENLPAFTANPSMLTARRAPAVTSGRATSAARFVYAIGGDNGSPAGALTSVEVAALTPFGVMGPWRAVPTSLPTPRTLAAVQSIGRFIYLVGGNGGNAPLASALRAEVLDPADSPAVTDVSLDPNQSGLGPGIWYYRVAAVMAVNDADNPGGETLPSDPQPVKIPQGLQQNLKATVAWSAVAGAAQYRIYRSPTANLVAGGEQLLATVPAGQTAFVDTGLATTAQVPRRLGDLGEWKSLPSLLAPREGLGLGLGRDPNTPSIWYLYATLGRTSGQATLTSYEYLPITLGVGGAQTTGVAWLPGTGQVSAGRWQVGTYSVDQRATIRYNPGETWIYVGPGANAAVAAGVNDVDGAKVLAGGLLSAWTPVSAPTGRAGYGFAAAANQLFIFGGGIGTPSAGGVSAQICGIGNACGAPPALKNWNAGIGLSTPRYLMGTAVESARIFVVGGVSGASPTNTVESTVW